VKVPSTGKGPRDVGGVEAVDLDPGVEQHAGRRPAMSPVFLIQCSVLAWSPEAQIES
jgi:hypothetical protein